MIVHVCIGSACHIKGAYNIINSLQKMINDSGLEDKVTVKAAFCLGECGKAVSVKIDDNEVFSVDDENIGEFYKKYILEILTKK